MDCPFSSERLRELIWTEEWKPAQIATLAGAATGEAVSEADVLGWLAAAGVPLRIPAAKPAPEPRKAAPRKRTRAGRASTGGRATLRCAECGVEFERLLSEIPKGEHAFCSRAHSEEWNRKQARARAAARRSDAARDLSALKRCGNCGEAKPLSEFSRDRHRSGGNEGRARICLECNKVKSRAYYERNAERLREKALQRKQAARATRGEA